MKGCSRCKGKDKYCSKKCQKDHWKIHKSSCFTMRERLSRCSVGFVNAVYVDKCSNKMDAVISDLRRILGEDLESLDANCCFDYLLFTGLIFSDKAFALKNVGEEITIAETFLNRAIEVLPGFCREACVELCLILEQQNRMKEAAQLAARMVPAQVFELGWINKYQRRKFMDFQLF